MNRSRIAWVVALATAVLFACTTDTLIGPKDVALLVIEPDTVVMPVGDTLLLEGVATDSRGVKYIGEQITWSSGDPSVVTISADGHLVAVAVGQTTVTAAAGGRSATAQVTVTPPATIATSADSLGFSAVAHGPLPASQTLIVTNGSAGSLAGLAAGAPVYGGPDSGWLTVTSPSSTAPDTITFAVTLDTFAVGTYSATVPITATKATNTPKTITVTLTLSAGAPAAAAKSAGDTQSAVVKTAVATAPAVIVTDAYGNGVAGVSVTFATTAGNGTLTGATTTTNASGVATLGAWTLDTVAKTDTLTATATALPPVTFTATARPAAAAILQKSAGDGQSATVGTQLPVAPAVTVRDRFGNPVPGATVTFAASAPSGSLTGATPVSDAQGLATAGSWTLGTTARTDSVTASVAGVASPLVFTATATAGAATSIVKSAGGTTGTVNAAVSPAPAVLVTDQFGNPVAGVGVTFAATASNGSVTGGTGTTSASGVATVGSWTLATTAKNDSLTATSGSLTGSPVLFVVTAHAGAAATLTKTAGDGQTHAAGTPVDTAPAVLVKDAFGNPVSGVTVTFAVATGGGSVTGATPVTSAAGAAAVGSWTLGAATGSNSLTASATGTTPVTFTATGTAGAADSVTRISAASRSDTIGATLALDSVRVADAFGNAVSGVTVSWGAGGAGTLTASSVTNGAGIATATRVLGTVVGTVTDTARVAGLIGSPVLFAVTTTPGQGATLVQGAGNGQTDTVAATLAVAYTDTVKDRAGNPVPGVTVTWTVTGGGGSITPSSVTNAAGAAAATRVLGTVAGAQTAAGAVTGLTGSPTPFTATATHGAAKLLSAVAGTNGQAATVNTAVSPPPAVLVTDQFSNPVSGVSVTYALGTGGARNGSITGTTPTTNASGVAALTSWTLGSTAGADTVIATSAGLTGSPLTFIDFGNSGSAATIAAAGGNGQTDTVRATLPRSDSVLVTDASLNPVSGVSVTWAVTKGGGSITPTSLTNGSGIATATWTLGDTAGTQNATATVGGLAGSPVTFSATATHGNAQVITMNAGDGQSATVNTTVGTAPAVLVSDAYGNPVSGVSVTFAVTGGAGSITGTNPATTDGSGIAAVASWQLGTTAGSNSLTATAAGLTGSPVTFTATGTAGAATAMAASAGTNDSATVNTAVSTAPAVTVTDQFGNPVSGVVVTFTPASVASGSVTGATPSTNGSGVAAVGSWTLGSAAKTDTLTATASGLTPVTFLATATAGAPTSIVSNAGDAQTDTIGATLSALKVLVTDAGGNPVPGATVTWTVTSGSATRSPATSLTDALGIASDTLTLGTTAGPVTVSASTGALTPAGFTATVTPGNPTTLTRTGGDLQSATVNTPVATAPSVQVTDRAGNGVDGVSITFATPVGHGSVTGGSVLTAGGGNAAVGSWTLDSIAGANTLNVSSGIALAGSPTAFSATGTAGAVDAALSTLSAGTASITACASGCSAGTTASTVTVTEVDQYGNPVSGSAVTFASTGTGNTFSPASGSTNSSGQLATTFNSTKAEAKTISVSGVTQTAGVTVTPAAVDLSTSTVAVSSGSMTACSTSCTTGAGTAVTVTVTVKDAFSNPRPGSSVSLSATGSVNTFTPSSGTTNASGQVTSTFNATLIGTHTVSATANLSMIVQTQNVTVNAAAAKTAAISSGNGQSAHVGSGVSTKPAVLITDTFGNAVPNVTVTFGSPGGGGSATGTSPTTNASGIATLTSWTMGSSSADASNGTMANTISASASGTNTVTFTDFGFFTWSGDVSPLIGPTGSFCSSCHAWNRNPNNIVGVAATCTSGLTLVTGTAGSATTSSSNFLYNKIQGTPVCGSQMPLSGTAFTTTQLKTVRAWINNGAQNN